MPGNETLYTSARSFFPFAWGIESIEADDGGKINPIGLPSSLRELPFPSRASVVSMTVALSQPLTAGRVTFKITRNGTAFGDSFQLRMEPSHGTSRSRVFNPGDLNFTINNEMGVRFSSSADLAPGTAVDAVVYFEVQPV